MKKTYSLLVILLLTLAPSCQKSQFPTTTRHSRNGKVSYANHFRSEKIALTAARPIPNTLRPALLPPAYPDLKPAIMDPAGPAPGLNPQAKTQDGDDLIASASGEPGLFAVRLPRVVLSADTLITEKQRPGDKTPAMLPDSVKTRVIPDSVSKNLPADVIIQMKTGENMMVRLTKIVHDTLYYQTTEDHLFLHQLMCLYLHISLKKQILCSYCILFYYHNIHFLQNHMH